MAPLGTLVWWVNSYFDPPREECGMVVRQEVNEKEPAYSSRHVMTTVIVCGPRRHGPLFTFDHPRFREFK